jgi:hypothetical protein
MENQKTGGDPATGATYVDALGMASIETGVVPRSAWDRTYEGRGPGSAGLHQAIHIVVGCVSCVESSLEEAPVMGLGGLDSPRSGSE